LLFALAVLLLSRIAHALGLAVTHPVTGKSIVAFNPLDRRGIQNIITKAVSNFTGFAFARSRVESVLLLTSRSPAYTVV
jgi:aminobenzoyl-glutamate transport protein